MPGWCSSTCRDWNNRDCRHNSCVDGRYSGSRIYRGTTVNCRCTGYRACGNVGGNAAENGQCELQTRLSVTYIFLVVTPGAAGTVVTGD